MRRTVIVMVKEPRTGQVKTRLGQGIGLNAAAWWFRHQSLGLLRRIRDPRWQIVLAVTPDIQGLQSRVWPADLRRIAQGQGDLGQRMRHAMVNVRNTPVCVIGADIPGIGRRQIARAFAALGSHQVVFGPATDGGYWLVGLKRPQCAPRPMFRNVRWSSEFALADSLRSFSGLSVALVDLLQDVDTAADLKAIRPDSATSFLPMTGGQRRARPKP